MSRTAKLLSLALAGGLLPGAAGASIRNPSQDQNPPPARSRAEETLECWNHIGNKLIALAKDFPEDKYDFKAQKDERTFAQNLLHVAAVDYDLIGKVSGSTIGPDFGKDKHNPSRDIYKTKADVVRVSYVWVTAIEHSAEHFGQLVVYYRANNLVPPESRRY